MSRKSEVRHVRLPDNRYWYRLLVDDVPRGPWRLVEAENFFPMRWVAELR